jgi:hypothetical protein
MGLRGRKKEAIGELSADIPKDYKKGYSYQEPHLEDTSRPSVLGPRSSLSIGIL